MRRQIVLGFLSLAIGCGSGATEGDGITIHPDAGRDVAASDDASDDSAQDDASTEAPDAAATDATDVAETSADLDGDGLADADEDAIAAAYLPFLSVDPKDGCPRGILAFRLRPHPDAPTTRLLMVVDFLLEKDCGASGHVGDDEVFGMTIDPKKPAPEGILAIRAISHQGTACEAKTNCGSCAGLEACTTAMRGGKPFPVVFYSKDKHGAYTKESTCDGACFFTNYCTLAKAPTEPKMINVGEPGKPLTNDLTKSGLITAANGWTETDLFDFDPWGGKDFGGAGNVTDDLVDPAFVTAACP